MSLLEVNDLHVVYERTGEPDVHAVRGITFSLDENQNFGLVGESGCGKTTVVKAILQGLPDNASITQGEILFDGKDLTQISRRQMDTIRWADISMIPQTAMAGLNPVYTIGAQIREAIRAHDDDVSKAAAIERGRELLELVGIDPDRVHSYPHELSGGMRQRAVIAMSLALDPRLIIADEPTTALDVIVQEQILYRISQLQQELGNSMLLITHDISVVAETCDKIGVMYGGELMEIGSVDQLFENSHHPYTLGLQNAFPSIDERRDLISIPGSPPDLANPPQGCPFVPRCPFAAEECNQPLPPVDVEDGHRTWCHEPTPFKRMRDVTGSSETWQREVPSQ